MKFSDNLYYIVPNNLKEVMLKKLSLEDKIYDIHFDTMENFIEKYICKIDKKAVEFLLEKGDSLDIINSYLKVLPSIDVNKEYDSLKLNFLKERKKLLISNDLLIDINDLTYLKDKEVIVMGYPFIDKYLEEVLTKINATIVIGIDKCPIKEIYEYKSKKEEIVALARRIRSLNEKGISYSKIFIAGKDDDSKFLINDIFKDFDIPYNDDGVSFLATIIGRKYLETKDLSLIKDNDLLKKIIKVLEEMLVFKDSKYYDLLLEDKLSKIKMPNKK